MADPVNQNQASSTVSAEPEGSTPAWESWFNVALWIGAIKTDGDAIVEPMDDLAERMVVRVKSRISGDFALGMSPNGTWYLGLRPELEFFGGAPWDSLCVYGGHLWLRGDNTYEDPALKVIIGLATTPDFLAELASDNKISITDIHMVGKEWMQGKTRMTLPLHAPRDSAAFRDWTNGA